MSTKSKRTLPLNKTNEDAASSGTSHDVPPPTKRPKNAVNAPKKRSTAPLKGEPSMQSIIATQIEQRSRGESVEPIPSIPALKAAAGLAAVSARIAQNAFEPKLSNPGDECPLLELPAEIRNEIWSYALDTPDSITIENRRPYFHEPGLLAVNRQVRSETVGIWYHDINFYIAGSNPAVKFLRAISDQQLSALRTLRIHTTVQPTAEYSVTRIKQLLREFEPRGLNR